MADPLHGGEGCPSAMCDISPVKSSLRVQARVLFVAKAGLTTGLRARGGPKAKGAPAVA